MDIVKYTDHEIIKNLALLENHLKQSPFSDEFFCKDCINKHGILLLGLAEEGMTAGGDSGKYQAVYNFAEGLKGKNFKRDGIDLSYAARMLRKNNFSDNCPECEEKLGAGNSIIVKKLTKDLNSKSSFNNSEDKHTQNSSNPKLNSKRSKNMITYTELGLMNGGQAAAEVVEYAVDTYAPAWEKWINLGGGVALQALGVFFLKKMPKMQLLSLVAGSNLLFKGVTKLVKPVVAPAAAVAARVAVAPAIPTRLARAGILASAAAGRFEAPEHADLIRVD